MESKTIISCSIISWERGQCIEGRGGHAIAETIGYGIRSEDEEEGV